MQKNLLDLIQTIVSYKLPRLSPQELARMFSISYIVGWVEERNPTKSLVILGFTIAQPNLHFLN
ncbi:hypothetical protein VB638_19425 [Dolichospermum sp. UHCC 0684]|uniref:Rpn family recombination-promoting nuclease/putative transposase n=1 Tax=unclassified Dolichospermum TaxID=2622029 RepID=UPI00211024D2|nr:MULTISPECIES: Rpn family recombination-promoting nuclease/putative transposase [unclassified Dolichospermum]MEA5531712.1 hypothetical protein [Dolichospermum sp. UHCC 0684]